jgi:hypothetical protein
MPACSLHATALHVLPAGRGHRSSAAWPYLRLPRKAGACNQSAVWQLQQTALATLQASFLDAAAFSPFLQDFTYHRNWIDMLHESC